MCHVLQDLVADVVAIAVIDMLEIVEVDEQNGERAWFRGLVLLFQAVVDASQKSLAVGEPGREGAQGLGVQGAATRREVTGLRAARDVG